jgi:hypothetical protein
MKTNIFTYVEKGWFASHQVPVLLVDQVVLEVDGSDQADQREQDEDYDEYQIEDVKTSLHT